MSSKSSYEGLSAQDSSFIMFERRATHMHVAALAILELGPLGSASGGVEAERFARYVSSRIDALPRHRQKLAFAPVSGHLSCGGSSCPHVEPQDLRRPQDLAARHTFHGVSREHLQRYLDEFVYRFDRRWQETEMFGFSPPSCPRHPIPLSPIGG